MARAVRLKVYRTPMGFYDAVVAAPSQAAALKAWGISANLFSEGLAEEVKGDPCLLAEASRNPGSIVRKPRGDQAELMARPAPARRLRKSVDSLPPKAKAAAEASGPKTHKTAEASAPKPPANRAALDAAETALAKAEAELATALKGIENERAELEARELRTRRECDRASLQKQKSIDTERRRFDAAS